jgi:very-short-patch-repair endonuclease
MSAGEVLRELGGLATRRLLVDRSSRAEVDGALRRGEIVALARGRYALPAVTQAAQVAHGLGGLLSHTSAALHHGWEVKHVPECPHVTLPRKRRPPAGAAARGVRLHYADVPSEDIIDAIATGIDLTLTQCLRTLPDDEALSVADSALRHGVPPATLRRVAMAVTGPGSAKVRRIASQARAEAANPFESCLRSVALTVPGLNVQPQVWLSPLTFRCDLVDADQGLVIEADSFEWHGDRAALRRDARRYNAMVVNGWFVLRFSWEDVMFHAEYVREVLVSAVALVRRQAQPCCRHRCAA